MALLRELLFWKPPNGLLKISVKIYDRNMQNLVSKIPIMVVEGNDEIEQQAGHEKFVAYSS